MAGGFQKFSDIQGIEFQLLVVFVYIDLFIGFLTFGLSFQFMFYVYVWVYIYICVYIQVYIEIYIYLYVCSGIQVYFTQLQFCVYVDKVQIFQISVSCFRFFFKRGFWVQEGFKRKFRKVFRFGFLIYFLFCRGIEMRVGCGSNNSGRSGVYLRGLTGCQALCLVLDLYRFIIYRRSLFYIGRN